MTDEHKDEALYDLPYVKRPDLRNDELDFLRSDKETLRAWQWWINGLSLYSDELNSDHEQITSLGLPNREDLHGLPDPIKTISYFCSCHEWGVYPPPWIMNYFYKQFSEYIEDNVQGKGTRLGEYFGETSRGAQKIAFKKHLFRPIMENANGDVDRLNLWFGINKNDAYALVAQYLETVENKTGYSFKKGPSAVEASYSEWRKKGHPERMAEYFKEHPPTRELKVNMLRRYPREAFDAYPSLQEYLID